MSAGRRDRQAGLTLIEVLVVLAVIGVGAGATMIAMGNGDRGRGADAEAMRLANTLSLGVDEAMISGLPLALRWSETGYEYLQMPAAGRNDCPDEWPAAKPEILRVPHELRGSLRLSMQGSAEIAPMILSVGAVSPTVTFYIKSGGAGWSVAFDGFSATPQAIVQ